jgi:hypothetical protein
MKKWITDMLSKSTNVSSKRVNGTIGFICSIIFIAIWARTEIPTLLYVSALLLGLETVSGVFKK